MHCKIRQIQKGTTQSGKANVGNWVLEIDNTPDLRLENIMVWTSSSNTLKQIHLYFDVQEAAIEYANKHQLEFTIVESPKNSPRRRTYAENFSVR